MNDYIEKVKAAVCKLLDHVARSGHNTLDLDTDEDFATVHAWIDGESYWAKGAMKDNGESLSFLECCENVLSEIEKDKASE